MERAGIEENKLALISSPSETGREAVTGNKHLLIAPKQKTITSHSNLVTFRLLSKSSFFENKIHNRSITSKNLFTKLLFNKGVSQDNKLNFFFNFPICLPKSAFIHSALHLRGPYGFLLFRERPKILEF